MCSSQKPLICLVDDEALVRQLAQKILESRGMVVRSYSSAAGFLAEFDESATSCVVTDLRMPHTDGLELQKR